ncbi:LysR family transcriptional regulator [Vibrio sinaloensis]|nr:LysR family transcriptional regulator [Vibrio sinaloensis]
MMNRLPSTKQLQVFLATAQHLNFTHAAEAMNMTQGAMSRQIQTLEALIGVALFHRHARGLSLTPEGERFCGLRRRDC